MKKEYKLYLKSNIQLSENTIKIYTYWINDFIKMGMNVENYITEKNMSKHQLKLFYYSLKTYNNYLKSINENYFDISNINVPKINHNTRVYLTSKESIQLLKSKICNKSIYNKRNKLIIWTLLETGIRVSEIINIRSQDIYPDEIMIKGKGSKSRRVLITNLLYSEIMNMNNEDFIFINKWGNPLTRKGIYNIIKNMSKKAKIKKHVSPHVLRHTFATNMLKNGIDIYSVSKLLGHSSIATTQIYLHFNKDIKKHHIKIMNKYII